MIRRLWQGLRVAGQRDVQSFGQWSKAPFQKKGEWEKKREGFIPSLQSPSTVMTVLTIKGTTWMDKQKIFFFFPFPPLFFLLFFMALGDRSRVLTWGACTCHLRRRTLGGFYKFTTPFENDLEVATRLLSNIFIPKPFLLLGRASHDCSFMAAHFSELHTLDEPGPAEDL